MVNELEMIYELALELDANGLPVPTNIEAHLNANGLFTSQLDTDEENYG